MEISTKCSILSLRFDAGFSYRYFTTMTTTFLERLLSRYSRNLLLLLVVIFARVSALAQEDSISRNEWRIGVLGGLSRLYHTSSLPLVPPQTCCGSYERGDSWGWWGGLSADYALLPQNIEIGARIAFARRTLALAQSISKFERFNGIDSYAPLVRHFAYSAVADYIMGDVGARIQPLSAVPLYLRLSADASFALRTQIPARETEQLASGTDAAYPESNALSRANTPTTPFLTQFAFGLTGALGIEIPIQTRLLLGVEAAYRYGLGTVRKDIDWRTNSLQGALTLRWRFLPEEKKTVETPSVETPPSRTKIAVKPLEIQSFDSKPLEIQETIVTQTFPLLPYIFFDSASVVVRNRYNPRIGTIAGFNENTLPKETLQIYYHLLYIIGKRMKDNPKTTLTITGTTDGKEWSNASQRQILAMQRARSVASFLTGYWGIAQSRIKLATRDTPKLASSDRYTEGNEENRRAELSSTDPELLRPVVQYRFLEYTPVRSEHYITVKLQNPSEAQSYKGSMEAAGETFAVTSGVDAPPGRLPFALRRKFTTKFAQGMSTIDSAECTLEITERNGDTVQAQTSIKVETIKNQYEVSRLNLIVFDFDRDDMLEANRLMMQSFVLDAIKPNSMVSVLGSTDRLGEARYNKELSESRARGVQDFMRRINPNILFQEVRGTGASTLPFDNDLPEGRYYCRTVSINVQTPRGN